MAYIKHGNLKIKLDDDDEVVYTWKERLISAVIKAGIFTVIFSICMHFLG